VDCLHQLHLFWLKLIFWQPDNSISTDTTKEVKEFAQRHENAKTEF
jgi:hypothetical protein